MSRGDHELSNLRRQKLPQAPNALDFGNLLGYPLLKRMIPICKICCLLQYSILKRLQPQNGSNSGHKRCLVNRLCQILVGASVESEHDVFCISLRGNENDGHEGKCTVPFQTTANLNSVEFWHHDIEQDEVWQKGFCGGKRLLAVRSLV